MLILLNNLKRVAALCLGLAIVVIQIPSASAAVVQFNYVGSDVDNSAFGSFTIDDVLFNATSSQAIQQSNLLSFSFSMTLLLANGDIPTFITGNWDLDDMLPEFNTSTIVFDSTGTPDVVGAGGFAAGGDSGSLAFAGTGSVSTGSFGSISSANGDWTLVPVSVIPLPAALPLYGAGLAVMGLMGWRRKRKAAARA